MAARKGGGKGGIMKTGLAMVVVLGFGAGLVRAESVGGSTEPARPAKVLGMEATGWSATTLEAAGDKVPALKPVTVTGEVVDVSCYLHMGKRGPKHAACGQECILNGQPAGVLTDDGTLYVVMPEEHTPRRKGEANATLRDHLRANISKPVTVTGFLLETQGAKGIFVRTLK